LFRQVEVKRIKEDNLVLICSQCSSPEPPFRCSLCHGASYCNSACQELDWKREGAGGPHWVTCQNLQAGGDAARNDAASNNGKMPDGKHVARRVKEPAGEVSRVALATTLRRYALHRFEDSSSPGKLAFDPPPLTVHVQSQGTRAAADPAAVSSRAANAAEEQSASPFLVRHLI
jgi:hypothetical protein